VFGLHQEGGQICIQVFFFRSGQNWGNRAYYPRADKSLDPAEVLAPTGAWRIGLKYQVASAQPVHLYTCWGGRNPGLPQRLQPTRFIVPKGMNGVRVTGTGSLLGSGCGQTTLMAGGYERWIRLARAEYSGGGAARGGKRAVLAPSGKVGADWLAATDEYPSLPGLLCIGTRSAALIRAQGTSFAAPQAARKLSAGVLAVFPAPAQALPQGSVQKPRDEYFEPRITVP